MLNLTEELWMLFENDVHLQLSATKRKARSANERKVTEDLKEAVEDSSILATNQQRLLVIIEWLEAGNCL